MKNVIVEFIGAGYEVIKFITVNASSFIDALEKAEKWYEEKDQNFTYCELEIKNARCIEF